jgi:hypothetical protein
MGVLRGLKQMALKLALAGDLVDGMGEEILGAGVC